jgi:autotransporter-associated beta strand protein/T5SS/PEP-CTERM-associated repeat protein
MTMTMTLRRFTAFLSAAAFAFAATAAIAAPGETGTFTIYGTTAAGQTSGGTNYAGGTITASGTVQLDDGATVSGNIVDNGLLLFNQSAGNLLTISNTVSGNGTLSLTNSGTLRLIGVSQTINQRGYIPLNMTINANSGVLTGSGAAQATQNTIFQLGVGGTGTLNIAGGLVTGTSWHVGVGSNSVGTVNVSSGFFAPKGGLLLGGTVGGTGGSGTLNITGGLVGDTEFISASLGTTSSVASGAGSTGLITITNGTFGSSSQLNIGNFGSGTVTLNSGGFLKVGQIVLGNGSAAQGTLNLLSGTAKGMSTVVVGGTGSGVLTVNGSLFQTRNATIGQSVGSNGTVTVTSGTWLNNASGIGNEIQGYLEVGGSGTGSLTIDNGGYVTVSGTFSRGANGTFALNQGGTLQIGSADGNNNPFTTASGTSGVLVGDLNYAGTLKFAQNRNGIGGSNVSTYGDVLSGSGDLIKTGTGTLNLTGNNSYTGGTKIEAGRISLGSANAIGTIGTISFSTTGTGPGALQFTATNTTDYSSRFSNAANQKYAVDTNGQDVTLASDLTSVGGSFTKFGAGSATLSGANTFTTGSVAAGTLIGTVNSLATTGTFGVATGGELRFNQASSGTWAGALAGSGTYTKLGAGALTLTGSTSNTNGTLLVSEGSVIGTTNTIRRAVTNNAQVTFNQTTSGTYASIMSGSGSLTKLGSGTVTLSGANTYSGDTTVSAGSLVGTTASLQGDITNNAAVTINNPTNGTYAGVMTGAGSLTKLGAGSVTLTGANTFSGGTTVSAGSLIGDTTSLQGNITNNTTLTFSQTTDGTYAGNISGTGILTKLGSGAVTLTGTSDYTGGTTVSAGSLIGTTNSLQGAITMVNTAVTFDQTTTGTYAGILSGNGSLTKLGGGTVILAANNNFIGPTVVSGGALFINGTHNSAVTVQNLATLGGSGTILSRLVTVQSGGTISPGNSPGLLTVGSLDLQAGSTTLMQIIGVGSAAGVAGTDYDKIAITEASGLGYGGTLSLDFANTATFADGTTFDLFGFIPATTGTFSSVTSTGSGSYGGLNFSGLGGVWTALLGGQTLTFSELTGLLSFQNSAVVPEIDPSSFGTALTLLIGSLGLLERRTRRRSRA